MARKIHNKLMRGYDKDKGKPFFKWGTYGHKFFYIARNVRDRERAKSEALGSRRQRKEKHLRKRRVRRTKRYIAMP